MNCISSSNIEAALRKIAQYKQLYFLVFFILCYGEIASNSYTSILDRKCHKDLSTRCCWTGGNCSYQLSAFLHGEKLHLLISEVLSDCCYIGFVYRLLPVLWEISFVNLAREYCLILSQSWRKVLTAARLMNDKECVLVSVKLLNPPAGTR